MTHQSRDTGEQQLIIRIRAGEHTAFEELFNKYHAGLIRFAHGYLPGETAVDDVISEVFLALWRTRANWDPSGTIAAYLYKSVRNRIINFIRDRSTEGRYQLDAIQEDPHWGMGEPARPQDLALEITNSSEQIWSAVATLPEKSRVVLTLRWREGLSVEEIAGVLEMTPGAIHTAHTRALKALRELLPKDI